MSVIICPTCGKPLRIEVDSEIRLFHRRHYMRFAEEFTIQGTVVRLQNAVAGLANRVLAYGADRILTGFPRAFAGRHARKVDWVGNPVREAFGGVAAPDVRFAGRTGPLSLLVVGGSLGAAGLNDRVPKALALLPQDARPQVVHQAGQQHIEAVRAAYRDTGVEAECVAFIDDTAEPKVDYDYLILGDPKPPPGTSAATLLSRLAPEGFASIDGAIAFGVARAPATPLSAPKPVDAYVLPGPTSMVPSAAGRTGQCSRPASPKVIRAVPPG